MNVPLEFVIKTLLSLKFLKNHERGNTWQERPIYLKL